MARMKSKNVFQNRLIANGKDGLVTVGEEFECSDDLAKDYERLGMAERLGGDDDHKEGAIAVEHDEHGGEDTADADKAAKAAPAPANKKAVEPVNKAAPDAAGKDAAGH